MYPEGFHSVNAANLSPSDFELARRNLNDAQYVRLWRGCTEPIGLVAIEETTQDQVFRIRASSGAQYLIHVHKTYRYVECTCPDACRRAHYTTCKHTCWLMYCLLGMSDVAWLNRFRHRMLMPVDVMRDIDKDRLLASRFRYLQLAHNDSLQSTYTGGVDDVDSVSETEAETESDDGQEYDSADFSVMHSMVDSLVAEQARRSTVSQDASEVDVQALVTKWAVFHDGFGGNAPAQGAECCVCYEDLVSEHHCVHCPGCRNHFHSHCILKWMAQGKVSCPLCRLQK